MPDNKKKQKEFEEFAQWLNKMHAGEDIYPFNGKNMPPVVVKDLFNRLVGEMPAEAQAAAKKKWSVLSEYFTGLEKSPYVAAQTLKIPQLRKEGSKTTFPSQKYEQDAANAVAQMRTAQTNQINDMLGPYLPRIKGQNGEDEFLMSAEPLFEQIGPLKR